MSKKIIGAEISVSDVKKDNTRGSNVFDVHNYDTDPSDKKFLNNLTTTNYTELGGKAHAKLFGFTYLEGGFYKYLGDIDSYRYFGVIRFEY